MPEEGGFRNIVESGEVAELPDIREIFANLSASQVT